jgi:hypothetical protein
MSKHSRLMFIKGHVSRALLNNILVGFKYFGSIELIVVLVGK